MNWHELDKRRFVLDYIQIINKYPHFKLYNSSEHGLFWEGDLFIDVCDINPPPFHIKLIYPPSYPIMAPKVYPISPEISPDDWGHKWHRWKEGNICYVRPKDWLQHYSILSVLDKTRVWYKNYILLINGLIEAIPNEDDLVPNDGDEIIDP